MVTIRTTTTGTDPLGYDGPLPERLRAMAEDAPVGRNQDAVEAETAVLRARLGLKPQTIPASPHRIVCATEDLPPEVIDAILQPLPDDPEAQALDHLMDEDPGEWSPEARRLLDQGAAGEQITQQPATQMDDEPEAPTP